MTVGGVSKNGPRGGPLDTRLAPLLGMRGKGRAP